MLVETKMIIEPLNSIQSIQEAVKQDPSLRVSLAKKYQGLGGTLVNGSIPLPYKEDIPAGYTKTSAGVYQPTVITSANVNEKVIPDLNEKVKDMSQTGTFVDSNGVERTADEIPVPEKDADAEFLKNLANFNRKFGRRDNDTTGIKKVSGGGIDTTGAFDEQGSVIGGTRKPTPQEEELDTIYNQNQALIDQMKTSLDASTKRQIDSIEAQFKIRKQQMEEINRRQQKGIEQTLLMGGSSRYAQLSSAGVVATKERDSLMKIAELDAQEKELVDAALSAQETGDFKLLEKKIELAETKRKEKQKETETLSKAIADENKRLREEKVKLDEADRIQFIGDFVSDSISSGITDVNEIYRELRKTGVSGTPKEVEEAQKKLKENEKELTKPIIRDTEIGGNIIREVIDPMTGKTISSTNLGPKLGAKEGVFKGFSGDEFIQIKSDLKEYGIDKVLEGITDPKQVAEIIKISGGVEKEAETKQFLTKDYLKGLYTTKQLEEAAAEAGFGDLGKGIFNLKDVDTEKYLTYLEGLVEQYREAGKTDQEILNLMK